MLVFVFVFVFSSAGNSATELGLRNLFFSKRLGPFPTAFRRGHVEELGVSSRAF